MTVACSYKIKMATEAFLAVLPYFRHNRHTPEEPLLPPFTIFYTTLLSFAQQALLYYGLLDKLCTWGKGRIFLVRENKHGQKFLPKVNSLAVLLLTRLLLHRCPLLGNFNSSAQVHFLWAF